MKTLLIVNSAASSVTPRGRVLIQSALSHDHDVTVSETTSRGHATELARAAVGQGYEAVIVMAGDGTLNEAANGLVGSDTVLGVVPSGSTNVFARTVGYVNDPIEATAQLLESMQANRWHRIGLGKANERYFLFHVGIGFDAAVVQQVERRAHLKRYAGHPLFAWSAFLTWGRYSAGRKPRFSVTFRTDKENESSLVEGYFSICMNSNPYTFAGNRPLNLAPGLTFDKALTIITIRSLSFATLSGLTVSALMSGKYLRNHRHTHVQGDIVESTVEGNGSFPYQLDGDYLGEVESLSLAYQPDVLNVFMPDYAP